MTMFTSLKRQVVKKMFVRSQKIWGNRHFESVKTRYSFRARPRVLLYTTPATAITKHSAFVACICTAEHNSDTRKQNNNALFPISLF